MKTTVLFDGDVRTLDGNPFHMETPFGSPLQIDRGNIFEENDRLRSALEPFADPHPMGDAYVKFDPRLICAARAALSPIRDKSE